MLQKAKILSLAQRRKQIIVKFSKKSLSSDTFCEWFKLNDTHGSRHQKPDYKPVPSRTVRFERSALPIMTKIVSWHPPLVYVPPDLK